MRGHCERRAIFTQNQIRQVNTNNFFLNQGSAERITNWHSTFPSLAFPASVAVLVGVSVDVSVGASEVAVSVGVSESMDESVGEDKSVEAVRVSVSH